MTNKPSGDGDRRNLGDAECALVNADHCVYMVLGALIDTVDELPGNVLAQCMDDAVSASAMPAAYCKLACTESWESVSND